MFLHCTLAVIVIVITHSPKYTRKSGMRMLVCEREGAEGSLQSHKLNSAVPKDT